MGIKHEIHEKILKNLSTVTEWACQKEKGLFVPFYSSFDIRDSGFKVATVDANIFPAGFNNICEVDSDRAEEISKEYLDTVYGVRTKKILLLTEEHTQNLFYWDNVAALVKILEGAGRVVRVAIPREDFTVMTIESATAQKIKVFPARRKGDGVEVDGFAPDLIISNNDFSKDYESWSQGLRVEINPPRAMGWYRRKKSHFFVEYNLVAKEFADLIGVDPWFFQAQTEVFEDFDLMNEGRVELLAQKVDRMLNSIAERYREHGLSEKPFVFIKNNSGTYGLGVIQVKSGDEVRALNYKSRKKMKAAKGGREVNEVIIQEGIATSVVADGVAAEPAIYLIGCKLVGGFLRTHKEKGIYDNLNSPGAVFKKLCVADLEVNVKGRPLENVYGWIAKIGLLAIGREFEFYLRTKQ